MLVTRQNRIPFLWVIMAMVPWAFFYFMITVNGVNFFILNRLIENPAVLTFFFSLPGLVFTFLPLGSYINFMSDRIWTRWGRRKIFLLVGFGGSAIVLFLYPMAGNVWIFLALMFAGAFFGCFIGPFESLKFEIIPPDMRGRSVALASWINTSMNIVFWMMVIGRMDEVVPSFGGHLNGVTILYWGAAIGLLIVVFIYVFGIHEVNPRSTITGEKFRIKTLWNALTMPQLRYLYLLSIAAGFLLASLGSIGMLLYINQWGYSFQEMGINIAIGGVINLFLIPLIGIVADKGHNRMRIWLTCSVVIMVLNIAYFSYVTWYLPDQRPSLVEMIFFGETTTIVGIISAMVFTPLLFDYLPRNIMGTYFAGSTIIGSIVAFLTGNGLGLFLLFWANIFQPPAGEMVRVCLDREMSQPQVAQILVGLVTPGGSPASPKDIVARPWYANGIVKDSGVCYEIRLRDAEGEATMKRRDDLKTRVDTLDAKIKQSRKSGAAAETLAAQEAKLAPIQAELATLGLELDKRAEAWRVEVVRVLGNHVVKDGAEVLNSTMAQAVVSLLPTTRKAKDREVDRLNKLLRAEDPSIIGLSTVRVDRGFALSAAVLLPEGGEKAEIMRGLCQRLAPLAKRWAPGLLADPISPSATAIKPAAIMDLALVEDPVRNFVSPISRVVNAILSRFTELPTPDQKLISLARNLCKGGGISQARVENLQGNNGLRLTVVGGNEMPGNPADWTSRLMEMARTEASSLKLTVLRPVIDQGVVPIKYNYLAGYLYVFFLVFVGFGLAMIFLSKERAGIVRKLGAEEAHSERKQASEAAIANRDQTAPVSAETYTPGCLVPKLLFALLGLAMILGATIQAWPDLRLLFIGRHGEAVAVSVAAAKPGQVEEIITSQAGLDAKIKEVGNAKDYNWTFYNEFTFDTEEGKEVTFRREVGCKLKPSMPLLDENGMFTTAQLLYDRQDPSRTVLPLEYSTWFFPALLGILGFGVFAIGAILAWFAERPIHLSAAPAINIEGPETSPAPEPTA